MPEALTAARALFSLDDGGARGDGYRRARSADRVRAGPVPRSQHRILHGACRERRGRAATRRCHPRRSTRNSTSRRGRRENPDLYFEIQSLNDYGQDRSARCSTRSTSSGVPCTRRSLPSLSRCMRRMPAPTCRCARPLANRAAAEIMPQPLCMTELLRWSNRVAGDRFARGPLAGVLTRPPAGGGAPTTANLMLCGRRARAAAPGSWRQRHLNGIVRAALRRRARRRRSALRCRCTALWARSRITRRTMACCSARLRASRT